MLVENLEDRPRRAQANVANSLRIRRIEPFGVDPAREPRALAHAKAAAGTRETAPDFSLPCRRDPLEQEDFDGAAARPFTAQARAHYARLVADEEIPRAENLRQLREPPVGVSARRTVQHEQP